MGGDIFKSNAMAIVNPVNCGGIMGKGLALEFKKKYPAMYKDYRKKCDEGHILPGRLSLWEDEKQTIINFPTKNHWKEKSQLSYVIEGLTYFRTHYRTWNIRSVAFPKLGCGLGGLDWRDVKNIMELHLSPLEIPVEIYV